MKRFFLFLMLTFLFLACGKESSYQLVSTATSVDCDCKTIKQSERWFKKRFGAKKYFKKQDSLYIPRDVIADQLHDYQQIRILSECTDHPLEQITYVDSIGPTSFERHFYYLEKADFKVFKKNKGCKN